MLCSSGFFRGVECPYGPACGRPYCHFRHPPGAQHATDGPTPSRRLLGLSGPGRRPATVGGCGYDPYNPELPKPVAQASNGTLENIVQSTSGILELELFDKAIEAAKNEVEREQKKYEELLETTKEYGSSEPPLLASKAAALATSDSFTSLEYSPGSYNASSDTDYNPTPLAVAAASQSSKYTLDSFNNMKCKGNSLEYIPTMVTQPKKYSSPVVNSKYIIDNSKPSTDLEYDPLSNYSARLLNKAKEQKGTKRKREDDHEEAYSPSFKKHCDTASSDEPIARFSDSEDECQEASIIPLKSKGDSESKLAVAKEKGTPQIDGSSRQMKETAVQYDMGDIECPQRTVVKDVLEKNAKLVKVPSSKDAKAKEKNKGAPKDKLRKKKDDDHKAQGKKNLDKTGDKEKIDVKTQHKNGERSKEKRSKSYIDGHVQKLNKPKSVMAPGIENSGKNKDVGKVSATEKSGASRKDGKSRPVELKRKPKISSGMEHDKRKGKQPALKRSKEALANSLAKENSGAKCKAKQRALSHVDLFGDESGDEQQVGQPLLPFPDVSSDSDRDDADLSLPSDNGVAIVNQLKLSQTAAAASSSSSSSDEIDYSILEKDLDFESDPMEECLRIFNESNDVKTEDKGRLGKQLSKEEGGEEKLTEDSLTTLFPGQKRRISHVTKQGHAEVPNKPVVRPYRPPTAQEVCYQRIQLAQKQAVQLVQQQPPKLPTTQLPVASQRASLVMHKGERKRVAHVPSAALSAVSKWVPGNLKKTIPPASVASSNGVDAPVLKARTLTGMASKTTTTSVPKRIAHTPTLQSTTLKRPVIPTEFGAKVPTNIRQRYLNLFIDECLKFCPSQQEAFDKALAEEKVVYERSTSRNIYLNVAVNTLKKLRTLLPSPSQDVQKTSNRKVVSHEAMLGGKLAARTSYTLNRSTSLRLEDLTGATLYRRFKEYVLTEDELKEHGYPLPCPERPGRAVVFATEEKKLTDGTCRVCCRCGTQYMVTPSGNCVRKEECIHHWGRLRKQRVPGGWETHYSCCSGAVGSLGCQVAKVCNHVRSNHEYKVTWTIFSLSIFAVLLL